MAVPSGNNADSVFSGGFRSTRRRVLFLISFAAAAIFVLLAASLESGAVRLADRGTAEIVSGFRAPLLTSVMFFVTNLGAAAAVGLLSLVAVTVLIKNGRLFDALFLAAAVFLSLASGELLKEALAVARPPFSLIPAAGGSFPSGHTLAIASFALPAALIFWRSGASRPMKIFTVAAAGAAIFAVAVSRLYLGVHWLSDVAGSFLLAVFWTAVLAAVWQSLVKKPETSSINH